MSTILNAFSAFFAGFSDTKPDQTQAATNSELLENPWLTMLLEGEGISQTDLAETIEEVRQKRR